MTTYGLWMTRWSFIQCSKILCVCWQLEISLAQGLHCIQSSNSTPGGNFLAGGHLFFFFHFVISNINSRCYVTVSHQCSRLKGSEGCSSHTRTLAHMNSSSCQSSAQTAAQSSASHSSVTHSPRLVVSGACQLPFSQETLASPSVSLSLCTHPAHLPINSCKLKSGMQRHTAKEECWNQTYPVITQMLTYEEHCIHIF